MENGRKKHKVFVGVGANVEDARRKVENAIGFLRALLGEFECSKLYETPCMGNSSAAPYTNAVVSGTTYYDNDCFVKICKVYERLNGRTNAVGEGVAIDLDLVISNGEVLRERDFNALHFRTGLTELSHGKN